MLSTTAGLRAGSAERIRTVPRLRGAMYDSPITAAGASQLTSACSKKKPAPNRSWKFGAGIVGSVRMWPPVSAKLLASLPRRNSSHLSAYFGSSASNMPMFPGASSCVTYTSGCSIRFSPTAGRSWIG